MVKKNFFPCTNVHEEGILLYDQKDNLYYVHDILSGKKFYTFFSWISFLRDSKKLYIIPSRHNGKIGLGLDELFEINKKLIYIRLTRFGQGSELFFLICRKYMKKISEMNYLLIGNIYIFF